MNIIASLFSDLRQARLQQTLANAAITTAAKPRDKYNLLRQYYVNNALYDEVQRVLWKDAARPAQAKGLRNPAFRVVEFYAAHLWPGTVDSALEIVMSDGANQNVPAAIKQVWDWSNWGSKKQVAARQLPMYGDWFMKVAQTGQDASDKRVFFQIIDPRYVTAFQEDERGYLVYIRIDMPRKINADLGFDMKSEDDWYITEEWDKKNLTFRMWEHKKGLDEKTDKLGDPIINVQPYDQIFGVDFIPFVHSKFIDIGEPRGIASYELQIDKIDETNQSVTRLHSMMYRHNRPINALVSNQTDAAGRPLPAPKIQTNATGEIEIGGEKLISLPGYDIKSVVPALDYEAYMNTINAMMDELADDLPEMTYYKLRDSDQLSGVAISYKMAPAMKRLQEARGNAENALIRADMMALTIGIRSGAFNAMGLGDLGDFAMGSFNHSFKDRPLFEFNQKDTAESEDARLKVIETKQRIGLDQKTALKEAGYTDDEIADIVASKESEAERFGANLIDQFNRGGIGNA